jgi:maltooligosyltrehalose synthase
VAFERAIGGQRLVCVVPRLTSKLVGGNAGWPIGDAWGDTKIDVGASARWRNAFTGEQLEGSSLQLRDVLATFPVAWLVAE